MASNILAPDEALKHPKLVGSKTINLARCRQWGFPVPDFVALPASLSEQLLSNPTFRQTVADEIIAMLPCERYAVRSSALIEDTEQQSFAGQFHTETDVAPSELTSAILAVLEQAREFLHGDLKQFSLIIQRYIAPDLAGVAFSRDPSGGRELVIEYGSGAGEQIVSGSIKPQAVRLYRSEVGPELLSDVIKTAKQLEKRFGAPQDVEWCMQNGTFYLLQTRPITTINSKAYEEIQALERLLPQSEPYYFEKTELTEVAPRPMPLTLDLLHRIYQQGGPVERAYKACGVAYIATDFLRVIGNELYVDKELEIQGLLPSFSYLSHPGFTPRFAHLSGVFRTLKNIITLNTISTKEHEALFTKLKQQLEAQDQPADLQSALDLLLHDYELIFRINLLSGLSLRKLTAWLQREPITEVQLIESSSLFVDWKRFQIDAPQHALGNSLDMSDESVFTTTDPSNARTPAVAKWWQYLPKHRQSLLRGRITESLVYNRLRELGRWLMVKRLSTLRTVILAEAKQHGYAHPKDIFFVRLADVMAGRHSKEQAKQALRDWQQFEPYTFPATLTSTYIETATTLQGVSAGVASGLLVTVDQLKTRHTSNKQVILYTEQLTPDLTQYFDQIAGIVSERGGLLSHLAIVAREQHIPIVVGCSLEYGPVTIGDTVHVDGDRGTVTPL